jgi:MFS family permease
MSGTRREPAVTSASWLPRAAHPISWAMLAITTLAILITSVDAQILPTVLPGIMKDFKLSPVEGGLLNSIYSGGIVCGALIFGVLSDVIGTGYRRGYTWILAEAIVIVGGVCSWLFAGVFAIFQWLRFPMGVSRGGSEPTNVALIGEWWQRENRGFAVGAHHTGFPFGQFLGPALMAVVLALATWREVYLLIPLIGIPIIIAQVLVGTRRNQQRVYDWIGEHELTPPLERLTQRSAVQSPIGVLRRAFRDRNTALSITMIFLFLWAELGVANFMTVYLTSKVHMGLAEAAVVSGASGITGWIGQVGWGTLSDRVGRKTCLRIISAGWTGAVLLMIAISSPVSAWLILLFWGLFRNSPYPVTYALLIDSVKESAGSGMGLMIGIALGVSGFLVSPVAGYFIQTWGWTADYVMLACACLLTYVPMYFLRETVQGGGAAVATQAA